MFLISISDNFFSHIPYPHSSSAQYVAVCARTVFKIRPWGANSLLLVDFSTNKLISRSLITFSLNDDR